MTGRACRGQFRERDGPFPLDDPALRVLLAAPLEMFEEVQVLHGGAAAARPHFQDLAALAAVLAAEHGDHIAFLDACHLFHLISVIEGHDYSDLLYPITVISFYNHRNHPKPLPERGR